MRFVFTMNMGAKSGTPVHQVIGDHPSDSVESLLKAMTSTDFITVDEYYVKADGIEPHGPVILNVMLVGKVKEASGRLLG